MDLPAEYHLFFLLICTYDNWYYPDCDKKVKSSLISVIDCIYMPDNYLAAEVLIL
jgi:hypothetical protein